MLAQRQLVRRGGRAVYLAFALFIFSLVALRSHVRTISGASRQSDSDSLAQFRNVWFQHGAGGMWYIPSFWLDEEGIQPGAQVQQADISILDAAGLALQITVRQRRFLNNSRIPLIVHQTWHAFDVDAWSATMRTNVPCWIATSTQCCAESLQGPEMAWFLWDDVGMDSLIFGYERSLHQNFKALPYAVERADVFRVAVLKWFGGVYTDVDTRPLKHPYEWIYESDLLPWTEWKSQRTHVPHTICTQDVNPHPNDTSALRDMAVSAIFGLEADNPPAPDPMYWRMGYTYPVQITNWAFAMASHHPVADQFLSHLKLETASRGSELNAVDPVILTGPAALTSAVRTVAEREEPGISWDALSARNDAGDGDRGKVINDSLILPITGFSPGRGWLHNMGSKSTTHNKARLEHMAAGSWRKADILVEYGKLCRVVFGLCRAWNTIVT